MLGTYSRTRSRGRTNHDYRDIEGRVTPGAVTEETESRMFQDEHDCMDAGGTVTGCNR